MSLDNPFLIAGGVIFLLGLVRAASLYFQGTGQRDQEEREPE
ncbi:hypothetical protein PV416_30240 [Streptomyces ipomoeae]|nr:hypothetical protein [Streptomyces ipomoeae]MDX2693037.1 hypothetical protein [Streptomyces ipomoeae]MDX2825248.1 hypothetical protein [Streptomyces ipomoeae]MDX2839698.1 hypothetical protein [Streptomyces ipomoeae]MDX2877796.1 hypothetical protein [Streptomyces ipomoeae]